MNRMLGACILYVYSSLHSYHDQRLKMGRRGWIFLVSMLGLTTSRDGF